MGPPGQGRDGPRPTRSRRRSDVGRRLTAERLRRGLTLAQAAEVIGVDPATLARWERGETRPVGKLALAAITRFLAKPK
jgi:transcriptional regulator with XRE-family HTH domain